MAARIRQILPASRRSLFLLAGLLALPLGEASAAVCDDLLAAEQRFAGRPSPELQDRIAYLKLVLEKEAADIQRVVAEAGLIPGRVVQGQAGPATECAELLASHRSALNDALKSFNEQRACLSTSYSSIPSDIIRIVRAMNNVQCGDAKQHATVSKSPFPTASKPSTPAPAAVTPPRSSGSDRVAPPPPISSSLPGRCSGPSPTGKQTRVPFVVGMSHQQAALELGLAGLKSFAFEYQKAESPSQNGKVTGTSPAPCTVVLLGSTIDVAYKGDYVASEGAPSQGGTPNQ